MAPLRGDVLTDAPITHYTTMSDGASVAYQTFGEGPLALLVVHALTVPIDLLWDDPGLVRVRNRLTSFSRNIWMEFRGWGASERDLSAQVALGETIYDEQISAVL